LPAEPLVICKYKNFFLQNKIPVPSTTGDPEKGFSPVDNRGPGKRLLARRQPGTWEQESSLPSAARLHIKEEGPDKVPVVIIMKTLKHLLFCLFL